MAIEDVLEQHARKHVGVVVGVCANGEAQTLGRGRIADDRPIPPAGDTIFEIGSITKVFTATVLADMTLEGLLSLDDPVQRYLPGGVEPPVRGRPITLADLATHTSGLPGLPKGMLRLALKERHNPYANFSVEDLYAALSNARLRRPPAKRMKYSNYGFGLLGHVLAFRAGQTYEELVTQRILLPLGMSDTAITVPDDKTGRFAQGHNRRGRPVSNWDIPTLAGAGALRSTVDDLLKFLALQLDDGQSRLAKAARMTHEPRMRKRVLSVGLGWFMLPVQRGQPHKAIWHDGGTGGFRSVAGFVKETRTSVVVLSNSSRPVDTIGLKVLREVLYG
jgi:D-alanyl-D-alanine-carboxypeptidase/D-alanyl-D-alanine-endopeptidase